MITYGKKISTGSQIKRRHISAPTYLKPTIQPQQKESSSTEFKALGILRVGLFAAEEGFVAVFPPAELVVRPLFALVNIALDLFSFFSTEAGSPARAAKAAELPFNLLLDLIPIFPQAAKAISKAGAKVYQKLVPQTAKAIAQADAKVLATAKSATVELELAAAANKIDGVKFGTTQREQELAIVERLKAKGNISDMEYASLRSEVETRIIFTKQKSSLDIENEIHQIEKFQREGLKNSIKAQKEYAKANNVFSKWYGETKTTIKSIPSVFKKKGPIGFFATKQGHLVTQKAQLLGANDVGREIIGGVYRTAKNSNMYKKIRNTLDLEAKLTTKIAKRAVKSILKTVIPVDSSWIYGVRIIKELPSATFAHIVVYFKRWFTTGLSRPVLIPNVPIWQITAFMNPAGSPGKYYKRHFAVSKNGSDLLKLSLLMNAASFINPQIVAFRNIQSINSNLFGVAKAIKKGEGPFSEKWLESLGLTLKRNTAKRAARLVGLTLGQTGGKLATGIVSGFINKKGQLKNFNATTLERAVATSFRTQFIKKQRSSGQRYGTSLRQIKRWGKELQRAKNNIKKFNSKYWK